MPFNAPSRLYCDLSGQWWDNGDSSGGTPMALTFTISCNPPPHTVTQSNAGRVPCRVFTVQTADVLRLIPLVIPAIATDGADPSTPIVMDCGVVSYSRTRGTITVRNVQRWNDTRSAGALLEMSRRGDTLPPSVELHLYAQGFVVAK